jgi:hypothetical protein
MNLKEEILKEHSKANAVKIAEWVGANERRFALLMDLFLQGEYRLVQRAAWIVSIVADNYSELIVPYLPAMMKRMQQQGLPVAVKRNVVRVLQNVNIPEKLHGTVMDDCFRFLSDPKETIAVRCFSMTVLANMAKSYPEIKDELKTLIENVFQHKTSAGLRARAKNLNL